MPDVSDRSSGSAVCAKMHDEHIETLVPVRVERLLDYSSCFGLLTIDGGHRERVRESYGRALA